MNFLRLKPGLLSTLLTASSALVFRARVLKNGTLSVDREATMKWCLIGGILAAIGTPLSGQQVADTTFQPVVENPAYSPGSGPVVLLDAAHHNFHTLDGRFLAFGRVLTADGYVVRSSSVPFSALSLQGADVLVISNALNERNVEDWSLPTPSAFTDVEIAAVRAWVEAGGSLWLIAGSHANAGRCE